MFLNTVVLGLGDPSVGSSGWVIYWPVWSVFYLPAIIVYLLLLSNQPVWLHGFAMIAILFLIEISFYFDVGLHIIIVELIVISIIFFFLGRVSAVGRVRPWP
jgi:hypothetical protein